MATTAGHARDRISNLPDSILVNILSSLPINEAARCSALASRWRHIFPSTLIDFKAYTTRSRNGQDTINTITAILAAHPAEPVRSFTVGELHLRGPDDKAAVDGWLRDLSTRGIQDLSLRFKYYSDEIPDSIFACCCSSLRRLRLTNGIFPDAAAAATSLRCSLITEINLSGVRISEGSLDSLLSQCAALEHLTIGSSSLGSLRLRSRSLRVLDSSGCSFTELFVDDAPSLERILHRYMSPGKVHITVARAPKLEFLAYIGMSNNMQIGDTTFTEGLIDVKTLMPSLKTLAIDLSCDQKGYIKEGYIYWLMQLLKLFPCLKTLYIRSSSWSLARGDMSGSWEAHRSVPCILEKVVFQAYRGYEWQREMAKFLHGTSEVLKIMEFHCMDDGTKEGFSTPPSQEWVREQKELLCLDSTAALDASLLFFKRQLLCNHFEVCHEERYRRNYYGNMYFDESVFRGQSWRA